MDISNILDSRDERFLNLCSLVLFYAKNVNMLIECLSVLSYSTFWHKFFSTSESRKLRDFGGKLKKYKLLIILSLSTPSVAIDATEPFKKTSTSKATLLQKQIEYFFMVNLVGCRHGSFQRPGTLATSDDYINRPLYYGAYFTVQIPPTVPQDAQCEWLIFFLVLYLAL